MSTDTILKDAIINQNVNKVNEILKNQPHDDNDLLYRSYAFMTYIIHTENQQLIDTYLKYDHNPFKNRYQSIISAVLRLNVHYDITSGNSTDELNCARCKYYDITKPNNLKYCHHRDYVENLALKLLNDYRAELIQNIDTYLEEATNNSITSFPKIINKLLEDQDYIDEYNRALYNSCCNGETDIVKKLLNAGIKIDKRNIKKVLYKAAYFGYHEIVEILLQIPGIDPSLYNSKALYEACKGADIYNSNKSDNNIKTALMLINNGRSTYDALNNRIIKKALMRKLFAVVDILFKYDSVRDSLDDVTKQKIIKFLDNHQKLLH